MGELKKRECREALTELYQFLDGELTDDRRSLIREHLDDCPPCDDAYDFEAELRAVIARKCREEVPESLRRRIAEAIGLAPDH
jgi:mycothiol system anti-sigma-R factor